MTVLPLALLLALAAAGPAAAQASWQYGGAGTWQAVPGSPRMQGAPPVAPPSVQSMAPSTPPPDLSANYQRLRQQRQLNERTESGSSLILQGMIPRSSR